jgi:hypothetical protein
MDSVYPLLLGRGRPSFGRATCRAIQLSASSPLDDTPCGRSPDGGLHDRLEHDCLARFERRFVALDEVLAAKAWVAGHGGGVLPHVHLQCDLLALLVGIADDGMRPHAGGGGHVPAQRHGRLQLPVDEVVYRVAKACHVMLIKCQRHVYADDVAVVKRPQRPRRVVQTHQIEESRCRRDIGLAISRILGDCRLYPHKVIAQVC